MFKLMVKRAIAAVMVLQLLGLGLAPAAQAAVISTEAALAIEQREGRIERIQSQVLRHDVQREMLALGVDPAEVQGRLAALTDDELQTLEGRLATLPAGGDSVLAVIGIVFLVLIILELVGAINIFKKL
jgi:hypothetical protein